MSSCAESAAVHSSSHLWIPLPLLRRENACLSRFDRDCTYANELGAAVTALGDGALLFDVEDTQVTTGGLDDTGTVGDRVVANRKRILSQYMLFLQYFSHEG